MIKNQEIEGQLELDLFTGLVKDSSKSPNIKRSKKEKSRILDSEEDIGKPSPSIKGISEESEISVEEVLKNPQESAVENKRNRTENTDSAVYINKEIDLEKLSIIKQYLASNGCIHLGTIMRICRISSMEANVYFEKLLADGKVNEKGRSTEKIVWTEKI